MLGITSFSNNINIFVSEFIDFFLNRFFRACEHECIRININSTVVDA